MSRSRISRPVRWLGWGVGLTTVLTQVDRALTRAVFGTRVAQPLAAADSVVVDVRTGPDSRRAATIITDPTAIARILAFVDARPRGWETSWHTPPATRVHATFHDDGAVLGWFGSGHGFLQAPAPDGEAAMHDAGPAELEELNRLLGIAPGSHLERTERR